MGYRLLVALVRTNTYTMARTDVYVRMYMCTCTCTPNMLNRRCQLAAQRLAALPEVLQPEPDRPGFSATQLKTQAREGFAKTGTLTPVIKQVLDDV
jgi:hypothetical protein